MEAASQSLLEVFFPSRTTPVSHHCTSVAGVRTLVYLPGSSIDDLVIPHQIICSLHPVPLLISLILSFVSFLVHVVSAHYILHPLEYYQLVIHRVMFHPALWTSGRSKALGGASSFHQVGSLLYILPHSLHCLPLYS